MNWRIAVAGRARKQLKRFPVADTDRIKHAVDDMADNPFRGDIEKMSGKENVWRRRVGAYRIFYEILNDRGIIRISEITRRTSHTY